MSLPAPQPSSSFQRQQHSKHHLADQPSNNLPLSDSSNILVETSVNLPSSPSSAPTTSSSTSSSFFSHGKLSSSLPPSNPSAITHPAIPHILHQLFSPNSAVILAPVTDDCPRAHEYQPTYRSVDEWAIQVAQQAAAVTAIDHQFTSYIASQLKTWALYSQDSQLEHVVKKTKHCAILLAARADAALRKVSSTASSSSRDTTNPPSPFSAPEHISNRLDQGSITNDSHQNSVLSLDHKTPSNGKTNHQALPDHTPYANAYKSQLVTVAAGYYTHLHREAINMLDQSSSTSTSSLLTSDHIISYNNNNSNINNTTSSSSSNSNINSNNNNNNNNSSSSSRTIRNRGIHHHKHSLHPNHHQFDPNCSQVPHSFLGLPEIQSQQQYPPNHPHLPQYFNQQHISDSHQPSVPTNSHSSPYNHHQHLRSSHPSHLLSSQLQHPLTSLSIPNSASLSLPSPSAINGYHTSAPNMTNTNFNGNQKPPSSPYKDLRTRNVQAAAVAALTANVMAATEIASHAGQTLSNLGMTIHADLTTPLPPSGPAAIAATQRTLELAQGLQPNQSLHTSSLEANPALISQAVINTTPLPTSQQQEVILHRNLNGSISGNLRNLSTSPHPLSSSLITLGAHQALPQPNRPSYRNDNHPANSYANQVERMWRMAQEGQCTDQARDQLLSFAHMTYSKKTSDPCLLPLLHTLARLHPNHLPTLLLLSCVYYSQGDYVSALYYNDQILSIDPDYVEAMSNMGTTQRALGRSAEAEELWWRAITIRPTYLDAFDNLIGVLCNSHSASSSNPQVQGQPRFAEALRLCKFVEAALFGPEELQFRPVRLPSIIPVTDAHRVQNLFYAKGNLLTATNRAALAHEEYVKALEVVLGPPMPKSVSVQDSDTEGYSLVDLVLAVTSIGIFMTALNASETGAPTDPAVLRSLSNTGIWDPNFCGVETVLADPLKAARQRRNVVRNRLLRMGGGILPCVLLLPESLDQLVSTVFSASSRALPVFQNYLTPQSSGGQAFPTRNAAFQSPNHTTSHLLLNMARYLQDASSFSSPGGVAASLDGIPPSPSLLLPLYYVAITLHPSPSTCNNLGILISTIPSSLTIYKRNEGRRVLSAQHVAHTYYIQGLQKDDRHPHLYTNLGSLLKDMGQLPQAVMMYDKAVQFNPNFDVALANLANAIKDMGRVQESVQWYKKAVVINPNFPEAVCGLVNALGGVCDWRDRGAVGNEPVVDVNGKLLGPPAPAPDGKLRAGLMGKVSRLVDRQLDEGISYGKGIMRQVAGLEQWLEAIAIIKTGRSDGSTTELRKRWRKKLEPFFGNLGEARSNTSRGAKFNEGGFLIRLIEQCTRQIQRRMYRDAYGTNLTSTSCTPKVNVSTERKGGTTSSYQRLTLPMALPAPPVPTVLPFHTFTYPLTARECRLISHRNALKISLTTLNQPWITQCSLPTSPATLSHRS
ncbi:expressed protein [Phakopsora pachyrhizi]|uniref:Expressed protein n=1 Tax=Phakopsora pachyrhizi TaxID=170000 RepID=A0AAV0BGI2_PHAPC|nr:expressed protein [Phakopsora pachyrhizi]